MKKPGTKFVFLILILLSICMIAVGADAALISVSGPNSSSGIAPAIIAAPTDALDDITTNLRMEGFDEAQGVVTTVDHLTDGGFIIAAGTLVDSHMIFLNSPGGTALSHNQVVWTFSDIILGVMSDSNGNLEAASTFELGNPATNYTVTFPGSGPAAPFAARGMEAADSYLVAGNQITVNMGVPKHHPSEIPVLAKQEESRYYIRDYLFSPLPAGNILFKERRSR